MRCYNIVLIFPIVRRVIWIIDNRSILLFSWRRTLLFCIFLFVFKFRFTLSRNFVPICYLFHYIRRATPTYSWTIHDTCKRIHTKCISSSYFFNIFFWLYHMNKPNTIQYTAFINTLVKWSYSFLSKWTVRPEWIGWPLLMWYLRPEQRNLSSLLSLCLEQGRTEHRLHMKTQQKATKKN